MKARRRILIGVAGSLLLVALVLLMFLGKTPPSERPKAAVLVRELTRDNLELRDGRLFAKNESQPFNGRLIEDFSPGKRKLEIDITAGKANGRSRGWHENGNREVNEIFVDGVSHGPRTRWHDNGRLKSTSVIVHGKVVEKFTEWHENGVKAAEMVLRDDGKPDGTVTAWYPSGSLKSRVTFKDGREVDRKLYDDVASLANVVPE